MSAFSSRRRIAIAGGIAVATVGAAGGTVLAVHGQSDTAAAVAATTSPSPAASPDATGKAHKGKGGHHQHLMIDRVVSVDTGSITVADHTGTQHTYTVAAKAKITDANGAPEALTALKPGELVVLVLGGGHHAKAAAGSTPTPSAAPATGSGEATTVVGIRDTGFATR